MKHYEVRSIKTGFSIVIRQTERLDIVEHDIQDYVEFKRRNGEKTENQFIILEVNEQKTATRNGLNISEEIHTTKKSVAYFKRGKVHMIEEGGQ